jgi:hypothetical protein
MFLNYIYSIKRISIGDYPTITMSIKLGNKLAIHDFV